MFAFDIETIPLTEALTAAFDRTAASPPANYKNPEAIEGWYVKEEARWRAARVKECSLNPRLGRIVAIGTADAKAEGVLLAMEPADEAGVLEQFWTRAHAAVYDARGSAGLPQLITWNGAFDIRFALIRSLALDVDVQVHPSVIRAWLRKYDSRTHFDVKAALLNHDVKVSGEGLDEWARFFGFEVKPDGTTGADVYAMVLNGEWERLRTYAQHDARVTWRLYEHVSRVFGGHDA